MRDDQELWKKNIRKKKLIRRTAILLLAFLLAGAAVFTIWIQPGMENSHYVYKEETVKRGSLIAGVTESSYVEASTLTQNYELDLTTSYSGSDSDETEEDEEEPEYLQIESMQAAVGQRVTEGEALFTLTSESIAAVRKKLQYNLSQSEIDLAEAQYNYSVDALTAQYTYDTGVLEGKNANANYQLALDEYQNQIAAYTNLILIAQNQIATAQEQLDDIYTAASYKTIRETYFSAQKKYESADPKDYYVFTSIQEEYLNAKQNFENQADKIYKLNDQITELNESIAEYQKKIEQLSNDSSLDELADRHTYEASELTAELAKMKYENSIASLEETLQESIDAKEEAEEKLEAFEEFVGDGTVYAQYNGLISELNYTQDDYLSSAGTMVSYIAEDALTLTVDVSQEDITNIMVGDTVSIDFSAYEDILFEGVVTEISITETSSGTATVSYPVTIQILGDTTKIFVGMDGNVTFETQSSENCLYVPRKAVIEKGSKTYVYQKDADGNMILTEVTTGLNNGISIEIISGLNEDDVIYLKTQVSEA